MVRGFLTRRFLTIGFLPALTLLYPCNPRNLWMVFPSTHFPIATVVENVETRMLNVRSVARIG